MDGIKQNFGDFLRVLRRSKGFKQQKDFAEATGVSQGTISRIENGTQKPTPDTLKIFSRVLNFSYTDLMVKAGYYDEEDLLGDEIINKEKENKGRNLVEIYKEKQNEKEFIQSLSLDDDKLLDKYQLTLDGKPLTKEEAKGIIAYLRSLRSLKPE